MVARINESKATTKDISCDCKCKFDGRKCTLNQRWIGGLKIVYEKNTMF